MMPISPTIRRRLGSRPRSILGAARKATFDFAAASPVAQDLKVYDPAVADWPQERMLAIGEEVVDHIRAFEDGADGVYVAGCMEGDCHFLTGNLKARRKVNYVKQVLTALGIEPERIEMFNMSSAQGPRFAQVAREFTQKIKELGPSPVNAAQAA